MAEYIEKQRSAAAIAADFGLWPQAVAFWLKKHGIPTRSTSETREDCHKRLRGKEKWWRKRLRRLVVGR